MSTSPALPLQKAIYAALSGSSAVTALVGARIYDHAPDAAPLPHIDLGEAQEIDDSAHELDASETYLTLHVWSRAPGQVEAKRIVAAIRTALDFLSPTLEDGHRGTLFFEDSRIMSDQDGITTHGVVTIKALTHA
jgi:hypothetical protein